MDLYEDQAVRDEMVATQTGLDTLQVPCSCRRKMRSKHLVADTAAKLHVAPCCCQALPLCSSDPGSCIHADLQKQLRPSCTCQCTSMVLVWLAPELAMCTADAPCPSVAAPRPGRGGGWR